MCTCYTPLTLQHYSSSSSSASAQHEDVDITFTATTSAAGTLLVGSSREFSGWGADPSPDVVTSILQRAAHFLPALEGVRADDASVRVGLRPYAAVSAGLCAL